MKRNFRKGGKGKPKSTTGNDTVVFVPSTRGGILIQSLKDEEDKMAEITGFRVKYQEAGGSILANAFDKNLGSGRTCGRANCPPCLETDGKVNCKARSIVYESQCLVCNPKTSLEEANQEDQPSRTMNTPREGIYVGESSRSLHERAVEHVRDAKSFSAKSHIVKHWMTTHPTLPNPPEVGFTIMGRFKDCLSRQISEALRINLSKDILLNSKGEYGNNCVSRLSVQEDAWEIRKRSRLEEEQEEVNMKMVAEFKRIKCAQYTPIPPNGKHTAGGEQTGHYPGSHCSPPLPPLGPIGEDNESTHEAETSPAQVTSVNHRQKMSWANVPQPDLTSCKKKGQKISRVNVLQPIVTQNLNGQKMSWTNVSQPVITSKTDRQKISWAKEPQPCSPSINRQKISWPKVAQPDPEMSDISDLSLTVSLPAEDIFPRTGPGGGGGVNTLTGTMCNIVERSVYETEIQPTYETDEEEFMSDRSTAEETMSTALIPKKEPDETINTAKRKVSVQRSSRASAQQYNLAYFNLWWGRMAVEGRKEAKVMKKREEEEARSRRKRKWRTNGAQNMNGQDNMKDGAEVDSEQVESHQFVNIWRGGDLCNNRGKSGRGVGEGVELPSNKIHERSQDLEKLKYGTSEDNLIVELEYLAPGSPVESTDGMDNNEESESS